MFLNIIPLITLLLLLTTLFVLQVLLTVKDHLRVQCVFYVASILHIAYFSLHYRFSGSSKIFGSQSGFMLAFCFIFLGLLLSIHCGWCRNDRLKKMSDMVLVGSLLNVLLAISLCLDYAIPFMHWVRGI